MAPEREISEEQFRAVCDWVYDVKGGRFVRNLFPGPYGIYEVNGEPLVIYGKDSPIYHQSGQFRDFGPTRHILFCNDKHAQQLEEAGIVNFSETPKSTR